MQHRRSRSVGSMRPVLAAVAASLTLAGLAPTSRGADPPAPGVSAAAAKTGTRYAADADMQGVLDALAELGPKPIETLEPSEARRQPTPADAVVAVLKKQGKDTTPATSVPGVTSTDQTLPGPAGQLPVRIYTPAGAGPFPIVVYFHGGGWVLADRAVYDSGARGLAKQANAVVVSVDYRLAPEAKFPAQHDDALAAYKWAAANATVINGDLRRIALAGESAGGNLALATAIGVREQNLPAPVHVVAVYPIAQASNLSTPSYQDSEKAKPLNKAMMEWFIGTTIAKPDDRKDPRIDLLNADLKGLPTVTLINARIDPLRSDADLLAAALRKAGVKVEHRIYDGVTHEFFGMAAAVAKARQAQAFAGQQLKQAFGTGPKA
jgi:acetyl esterase